MWRAKLSTLVLLLLGGLVRAQSPQPALDWNAWRDLPVQNGGRCKPLDSLARETLRLLGNRSSFVDPETAEPLDPLALYLTMLFDWKGADQKDAERRLQTDAWHRLYFQLHEPDKWDDAPLLNVDFLKLRTLIGLPENQKYISPTSLSRTLVVDPRTDQQTPFPAWGERLDQMEKQGETLSKLEEKGLELANRLWTYQNHRMGRGLYLLPVPESQLQEWTPLAQLLLTRFDDSTDPRGAYRRIQHCLRDARAAYVAGDAASFTRAADELKAALREAGDQIGGYPPEARMQLELAYNLWTPFRHAWIFMLVSALSMLLCMGTNWRPFQIIAGGSYLLGLVAIVIGFAMRMMIAARPPVTNMYESVVYVGFGVALFGMIFEWIYRQRFVLTAAAVVSTLALMLADNCPTVLDPSVRPLEPVLRSNFWLVTHVMTITLSYAAFALALGISNITLGYFLVRSTNSEAIASLSRFTYKAIQVGVLLLAAGTILGGVWADYSWGRFWGWDPKEVWALVALLGYLCVLHARFAGLVDHRGLAALCVVCFSLVVMAWYGVNFVLGAGLHSYGFGGGGQGLVYGAIALQWAYAALAWFRSRPIEPRRHVESPSLSYADNNGIAQTA